MLNPLVTFTYTSPLRGMRCVECKMIREKRSHFANLENCLYYYSTSKLCVAPKTHFISHLIWGSLPPRFCYSVCSRRISHTVGGVRTCLCMDLYFKVREKSNAIINSRSNHKAYWRLRSKAPSWRGGGGGGIKSLTGPRTEAACTPLSPRHEDRRRHSEETQRRKEQHKKGEKNRSPGFFFS